MNRDRSNLEEPEPLTYEEMEELCRLFGNRAPMLDWLDKNEPEGLSQ